MFNFFFLNLVVFQFVVLTICHCAELNSNETEAKVFLNQTSSKLFEFYDDKEKNTNDIKFLKKLIKDSREFDFKNFKDKKLKYAFEVLVKEADIRIIDEEKYSELLDSLRDLDGLRKELFIHNYYNGSFELPYSPDIENEIEKSKNPYELEYYWSEWRKLTGEWAEDNLDITLEALKQAAELTELSPLEFWLRDFNMTDMENLMTNLQPLYLELHAFVRNLLQKRYGESIIPSDGLIPDHIFGQISYQIKTNKSIIEEMFPNEDLPLVEIRKFNATNLYKIADDFFENLGFEKYPSTTWEDRIKISESESDDECTPEVWYFSPNINLEYCEKMNYYDFLDAYANMASIYYAKEMVGLPAYYFYTPNNLENGIGKALILSSSTYHNLKAIAMIPDDADITSDVEMNRLLRMAISHLLYIPLDFIHVKVMADLVSGNIVTSELNKYYWELMAKYAGVGPPEDHETDTFDMPINFYQEMTDNIMSSDFLMEIFSYQIYKKLCELSGEYPKRPLHLCDINGSKEAGNALKKLMQPGISKPFNEIIASMFPENPMVGVEGLLEYYIPIQKFLADRNNEANAKPGWSNSDQ